MTNIFRILAAALIILLTPSYFGASSSSRGSAVAARVEDEYRLVYPASCVATLKTINSEAEEVRRSKLDSFVAQLNKAGAEGYRLTSFAYVNSGVPVGVVKQAGAGYEYTWLEYRDQTGWLRGAGGFMERFAELARKGFGLVDYALFDLYCNPLSPDYTSPGDPTGQTCASEYVFLLGRQIGVEKPVRFAVVGSETEPAVPAEVEVKRRLSEGLFPKHVFSGYEIWFEDNGAGDARWVGRPEVKLVWYEKSLWASDIMKRVNDAAKRGYRVGLTQWGTALMYRHGGAGGYSYVWVKAKKKDFEKQLARLQTQGAIYLMKYRNEDELVFERSLTGEGKRREYKVLKFEFKFEEDAGGKQVRIVLAPPGQEALGTMPGLLREGFAVRDVFYPKAPAVILER